MHCFAGFYAKLAINASAHPCVSVKPNQFCQLGQVNKSACLQMLLFIISLRGRKRQELGKSFSQLLKRCVRAKGDECRNTRDVSVQSSPGHRGWQMRLEEEFAAMQMILAPILISSLCQLLAARSAGAQQRRSRLCALLASRCERWRNPAASPDGLCFAIIYNPDGFVRVHPVPQCPLFCSC